MKWRTGVVLFPRDPKQSVMHSNFWSTVIHNTAYISLQAPDTAEQKHQHSVALSPDTTLRNG